MSNSAKTKGRRSKIQREQDLLSTSRLYLMGHTQRAIAEKIGVSQNQIFRDLGEIKKRWRMQALDNVQEVVNRELEKVDLLESEAWIAWERSKEKKTSISREKNQVSLGKDSAKDDMPADMPAQMKMVHKEEERDGNPAYLAQVQWCIKTRLEIFGVLGNNAYNKIELNILGHNVDITETIQVERDVLDGMEIHELEALQKSQALLRKGVTVDGEVTRSTSDRRGVDRKGAG